MTLQEQEDQLSSLYAYIVGLRTYDPGNPDLPALVQQRDDLVATYVSDGGMNWYGK